VTVVAGREEKERLLLVAAIGDPGDAEEAYRRWRATVDLQELEGASIRVLPLLAARAEAADDHPVNSQVAKVVRFSWLKSQLLVTRLLPSIQALVAADIPVMLTKGAAVVHHTHGKLHLRPMNDLDVAVPRGRAGPAASLLVRRGLLAPDLPARARGAAIFDHVHAVAFTDPESQAELDLHWQVVHGSLHRTASDEFWARSTDGDLRGTPVRVLAPEDTLVQVMAHGQRWNVDRPLVWITDAALLLRGRSDVDWELVADVSARHRVADVTADGLAILRGLAPSLVPERLPRSLRPRRRTDAARLEHWREFERRTVAPGRRPHPRDLLAYARESLAFDHPRELPGLARWWAGGRRRGLRPATEATGLPPLAAGDGVDFTAGGRGQLLLGPGWWAPDHYGCWSRGRECVLDVPLSATLAPRAELRLELVPMVGGPVREQRVTVFRDGLPLVTWRFATWQEESRVLEIPIMAEDGVARLRFVVGARISPAAAGAGADHRPVGFALRTLVVNRV